MKLLNYKATWWCGDLATPSDGSKLAYPTSIADTEPVANLALKFEINVPGEGLQDGVVSMEFNGKYTYTWTPTAQGTLKTNGWQTVTILLTLLGNNPATSKDIEGATFNIFYNNGNGKQATDVNLAWDNFRIVKVK